MCKCMIEVKSKNTYNISKAFVPCGWCEECQMMKKTEWTNRLLIEMNYYQKKKNYKVGFITLTYNDAHLPHIPSKFLKNPNEKIPCFQYEDIKKMNATIRKYTWSKTGIKNAYRYFVTCEYGEQYHRPHMHGIFLFHPLFSHLEFYRLIEDAWTGTTTYIQNNERRGTHRENHGFISRFEEFTPKDSRSCGGYVAKYVCKDIEFRQSIIGKIRDNLTEKEKHELRKFEPFHRQSLGLSSIAINDKNALEYIENGTSVIGHKKNIELPNYIKDKLLYKNYNTYNLKTHNYEQRKIYNKLYFENKLKIYTKKYRQNKTLFEKLQTKEYWEAHQEDKRKRENAINDIQAITEVIPTTELARFYTTYYGLEYKQCADIEPQEMLFQRYNPCADLTEHELIDKNYYEQMKTACDIIIGYTQINNRKEESEQTKKDKQIKAFWNKLKNQEQTNKEVKNAVA